MAKKAKKAPAAGEAESAEGAPPAKSGGKKKLVIIAAAILLLGGGGAGGWFMMRKPAGHAGGGHEEARKPVAFLDVQEMTVNLATEPGASVDRPRFLKLRVSLELKDARLAGEVQPLLPRVQDVFQVFVRELRVSDLDGSGGIHRLREELLRRVNLVLAPTRVEAVLFKEVVVQ